MNDENDRHFLFAIIVIFSLALAVIAYFCGEDMIKNTKLKYIIYAVFVALVIIIGHLLFYTSKNESKKLCKSWCVYSENDELPDDVEKLFINNSIEEIKILPPLKNLKSVEFDSSSLKIANDAFSKCRNIEEITFFFFFLNLECNAFANCIALKVVNLVGDYSDWKDFEIKVPASCKIKFIPTKTLKIYESTKSNEVSIIMNERIKLSSENCCEIKTSNKSKADKSHLKNNTCK